MNMNRRILKYFYKLVKPSIINYKNVQLKIDDSLISNHIKNIIYNFTYEKEEILILSKVLSKEDIVMEVGAGMGFLSTFCAKVNNNKVVAYEANPNMIKLIKENYILNNVKPNIKNIILSDKVGEVEFYIEKNFYSSSTQKRTEDAELIKVKTENINNEIEKYKSTFLIIDIEGGEKDLIKKIDFSNNNINKILIELHPHVIGDKNTNEVLKYIIDNNFLLDTAKSGNYVYYFYRDL
jgi:FkbM family methyltransferase